MEIFDVNRRDIHSFDDYMDLKKPGFGGPASAKALKDLKGKFVNKDRKLQGYNRTVKRDKAFDHPVYNPTYKAMGGDSIHKQEVGKNPYDYPHTNNTGIPVVNVANEGKCYTNFTEFIITK